MRVSSVPSAEHAVFILHNSSRERKKKRNQPKLSPHELCLVDTSPASCDGRFLNPFAEGTLSIAHHSPVKGTVRILAGGWGGT